MNDGLVGLAAWLLEELGAWGEHTRAGQDPEPQHTTETPEDSVDQSDTERGSGNQTSHTQTIHLRERGAPMTVPLDSVTAGPGATNGTHAHAHIECLAGSPVAPAPAPTQAAMKLSSAGSHGQAPPSTRTPAPGAWPLALFPAQPWPCCLGRANQWIQALSRKQNNQGHLFSRSQTQGASLIFQSLWFPSVQKSSCPESHLSQLLGPYSVQGLEGGAGSLLPQHPGHPPSPPTSPRPPSLARTKTFLDKNVL